MKFEDLVLVLPKYLICLRVYPLKGIFDTRLVFFSIWLETNIPSLSDVAGCDITLNVTDTKQYIATEGYPKGYKNNQTCNFNFLAPPGRIFFVMIEHFDLEVCCDRLHFRKLHNVEEPFLVLQGRLSLFEKIRWNSILILDLIFQQMVLNIMWILQPYSDQIPIQLLSNLNQITV